MNAQWQIERHRGDRCWGSFLNRLTIPRADYHDKSTFYATLLDYYPHGHDFVHLDRRILRLPSYRQRMPLQVPRHGIPLTINNVMLVCPMPVP